jgi:hypothetical protein
MGRDISSRRIGSRNEGDRRNEDLAAVDAVSRLDDERPSLAPVRNLKMHGLDSQYAPGDEVGALRLRMPIAPVPAASAHSRVPRRIAECS